MNDQSFELSLTRETQTTNFFVFVKITLTGWR